MSAPTRPQQMRFRLNEGQMMVISPENDVQLRPIKVIYDKENDAFGILLMGDTQLRGYSFFVSQQQLKAARDHGKETNQLKLS